MVREKLLAQGIVSALANCIHVSSFGLLILKHHFCVVTLSDYNQPDLQVSAYILIMAHSCSMKTTKTFLHHNSASKSRNYILHDES